MSVRLISLVKVYSVGHVVDVLEDLSEAELVLDDALLGRLHQRDANNLDDLKRVE